ncbi:aminotransferase class V-fold PLP-dependent enzyme [Microbulbifer salipaludis]|uniref:Aminotransferase class V-fold PLP-dependent enzyme n=1 Tax=Microbulbifer salipaludis TaxID=187980 RepID=A0ABS3E7Z0_9GAMM|nr:aminotransferase class V-fold PLP-dependent enzyme [Microbulbifer salipaludis]MBN8431409.1 aminotransferase class V-fold PLP-dependent enzyme [Microbulbifer salipaludis]
MHSHAQAASVPDAPDTDTESLLQRIRNNVIGERMPMETPFGQRPLIYADYTASGRALRFIEDAIRNRVLPWYANTHTETSATGRQTTAFREQARAAIRKSVNAGDDHAIIFCGAGATAAVNRLVDCLGLRADSYQRLGGEPGSIPEEKRPVVFIGPYEHHSNDLPWRESVAEVVTIPQNDAGGVDLQALQAALDKYAARPMKIGSFSAASNVTGIRTDVEAVTRLLHQNGALSFWDYAAAGPYVGINVQGEDDLASKDALFLSPHKFVGGPGTPGILVVRKNLLPESQPAVTGGGTVSWVSPGRHTYLPAGERREEAGTPAIVESVRAGMAFALKDQVGADTIEAREAAWITRAFARWSTNENIEILGGTAAERVSIVSLHLLHDGKPLHHGFVVALLNDLFGIQVRGGCSCAGPYGHHLLHLTDAQSTAIEKLVSEGESILKPGWVRLNFNYFLDEETVDYLIDAIELIAEYGARMLPYYQYDTGNGVWRYQGIEGDAPLTLTFDGEDAAPQVLAMPLQEFIQQARSILANPPGEKCAQPVLSPEGENLRWFKL